MSGTNHREVLASVLEMMTTLAGDWEYEAEITSETYLLGDLGLESLDLVVLGTSIQQRYGRLPFAEYLAEIGQRPIEQRDVSVGDLVAFVCSNRIGVTTGGAQ